MDAMVQWWRRQSPAAKMTIGAVGVAGVGLVAYGIASGGLVIATRSAVVVLGPAAKAFARARALPI